MDITAERRSGGRNLTRALSRPGSGSLLFSPLVSTEAGQLQAVGFSVGCEGGYLFCTCSGTSRRRRDLPDYRRTRRASLIQHRSVAFRPLEPLSSYPVPTFPLYSPLNFVLHVPLASMALLGGALGLFRALRAAVRGARVRRDEAGLDPRLLVGRTRSWNPWLADCGEVLALRALWGDRRALRERDRTLSNRSAAQSICCAPAPSARTVGRRFLRPQRHDFKSGIGAR